MSEIPFEGSLNDNKFTKAARRGLKHALRLFTKKSEYFATYHERPKYADKVESWPDQKDQSHVAIVVQGPIAEQYDFTVETFKLYACIFPGAKLILSTWIDTSEDLLAPLRALDNTQIILSDKPEDPGNYNINMQLTSASAAVKAAHAQGFEWILKTRTDQRLYNPNALGYLVSTCKSFPITVETQQKYRIIGVGQGTLKYAPYHMTDQTVFGHGDDMLNYWTPPLRCSRDAKYGSLSAAEAYTSLPVGELCQHACAESYLASEFLKREGRRLEWTLADSWAAYRDHFCVIDYSASDFYWAKVQTHTVREYTHRYLAVDNRQELCFNEWLMLYSGITAPESASSLKGVFDLKFTSEIPASTHR